MAFQKTCPECGTDRIKTLVPMIGKESAYLCANGHFFLDPPKPVALAPASRPAST